MDGAAGMRRYRLLASSLVVALAGVAFAVAAGADDHEPVSRVAGDDRFATAGALAQRVDGDTLWLATGTDFADALAASAVGTGPVLLVTRDFAPQATLDAAGALDGIERIRVVGGRAVVGDAPVDAVTDAAGVDDVQRLSGADRFATAAAVADHLHDTAAVAYVATGSDFADALTASAAAGDRAVPLLLATRDSLPDATRSALDELAVDEVVVVGGEDAIGASVEDELGRYAANVGRLEGPERFSTAVAVSQHRHSREATDAYVATGEDFPDVLAAAPAAISEGTPLLLTARTSLPDVTAGELDRLGVERVRIAGGSQAVSASVADALRAALGPDPIVEVVAEGFDHPWGMAFLPDAAGLLVTERDGALKVVDPASGAVTDIAGVPGVDDRGQGGLLDVAVHPDFPDPDWVYITYADGDGSGATSTHLARGRLDPDQGQLDDVDVLFVAEPFIDSTIHYGSRITFGPDDHLFMTIGDRGDKNFDDHRSQDTTNTLGTTIRLAPDGSVPADNPFVDDAGAADEIYSYGHRNAQAMTVHPDTGQLWQGEHGEEDGDELNIIEAGGNHGWPVAHTGCEYGTTTPIGDHPEDRDDTVNPVHYWECGTGGFPPSGMTFYDGDAFPQWQGDLFVGSLASQYLARFTVDGREVTEADALLDGEGWRIRDVAVGPDDGALYVAIDAANVPLVRLTPGE